MNGAPWCEPCGNAVADDAKPNLALGALVLGGGWGLTTVAWVAKVTLLRYPIPYFLVAMFLGYAGSLYAAWYVAAPPTPAAPPRVERR